MCQLHKTMSDGLCLSIVVAFTHLCQYERTILGVLTPFSSERQHLSYDGCLEVIEEIIRTVLCCIVLKLCTVINTLRWAVLTVLWIGFCLTGPISLCLDSFVCFFVLSCHTAYVSYYCNTVGCTWWDWSLILEYLPSVLWHCWLGHLTLKNLFCLLRTTVPSDWCLYSTLQMHLITYVYHSQRSVC